jgi:xylulokinase
MRDAFLAIDVGTQSSRAAVLTLDGHVLAIASRPHTMATPRPGWAEQNPADWWDATLRNVRDVVSETADRVWVRAVAACGQMHGAVPVARDGALLAAAVQLWCDKRAAPVATEIDALPDRDAVMLRAGNVPAPAWSGFKMAWMKREQPELYDRAWKILAPKDFINFRLTGVAATDLSEASGSFLMDSSDGTWSRELIELLDLEDRHLPPVHTSSEVIGTILPEVTRETGLLPGTPVVAGCGDMLALLLGAGVTAPGAACDTSGTASIISFYARHPIADRRLMNLHAAGPHWISFGILDSGGGSLRWWRDQFIADKDNDGDVVYEHMMVDAASVPVGSEGLLFLPYLLGERTLGSADSRGVFFWTSSAARPGSCHAGYPRGHLLRPTAKLGNRAGGRPDNCRDADRGWWRALGALVADQGRCLWNSSFHAPPRGSGHPRCGNACWRRYRGVHLRGRRSQPAGKDTRAVYPGPTHH